MIARYYFNSGKTLTVTKMNGTSPYIDFRLDPPVESTGYQSYTMVFNGADGADEIRRTLKSVLGFIDDAVD